MQVVARKKDKKAEDPPFPALGRLLKERRNERGLSLQDLAEKTGISRRQIALMETGANTSLTYLAAVIEELSLDVLPLGVRVRISMPDAEKLRTAARKASEAAREASSLLSALSIGSE